MGQKKTKMQIRVFGPFSLSLENGTEIRIGSKKQKIILAMLVTAPEGMRSRAHLEDMLWSLTGKEQAQGNLRQAVMALRRNLNRDGKEILFADHMNVWIDKEEIAVLGSPDSGEFLEGINLPHELGYDSWVKARRLQGKQPAVPLEPKPIINAESLLRPTIAVIPFSSALNDESGKVVGDMIAESVIYALSRSNLVNVISHLSSRKLDPRSVSIDTIKDNLKADHVVTGRIRTQNGKTAVESEVIHVASGQIRGGYQDHFSIPDFLANEASIIEDIASEIGRCLFASSVSGATSQSLGDVACHDLMMSGVFLMHQQALAGFSTGRKHLEEASRRVPHSAIPLAWLSKWYVLSIQQGWSTDLRKDAMIAQDYAARALDLNPACSFSLSVDGFVQNNLLKNYDEAMARFDEALSLDPNNPLSWLLKGTLNAFMDLGKEATTCTSHARKLSPLDPHKYFFDSLSATAALANKDYSEALRLADRSLQANFHHTSTQRVKTIAHMQLGNEQEARASAKILLKLEPTLTVKSYLHKHPAANFQTGKDWAHALQKAGVPKS